ncbi:MAG: hypothetical protein DHS20C18_11950 [Saprospiraceae bacterium]|nr:MAG: hypothetical protein DHS20C18_11950 [Saprospiraceae bacterium]
MRSIPDADIIHQLKSSSNKEVDGAISYLHQRTFQSVWRFIKKNSGHFADAEDVFQEGLLAFYKLVRQGKIEETVKVEAYLFSICRNLWLKQLNKKKDTTEWESVPPLESAEDLQLDGLLKIERKEVLDKVMQQLGEKCREILIYYYYDRMRMKNIAELMGLSNEQVAKNKKSGCMKKMRNLVLEQPFYKTYFGNN